MKCKLQGWQHSSEIWSSKCNTYDLQYASDLHSKTPVLIDDLGGIRFLLSSSLVLWEPSHNMELCAAWLAREEEQLLKVWVPLALTQILGTSMHNLKKAAATVSFAYPISSDAQHQVHEIGSCLYFLAAAIPIPSLRPWREAWRMLTEPTQEKQVILVGSQVKSP